VNAPAERDSLECAGVFSDVLKGLENPFIDIYDV
jgi:hypothetical protein